MNKKQTICFIVTILAFFIMIILSLISGGSTVSLQDVVQLLFQPSEVSSLARIIILEIRLPRMIGAICVGATLAASGTLIKAVMRNPLADPGLLGIQTGASLFAMVILLVYPVMLPLLPIAAFMGGLVAYFILTILAYKDGIQPLRLVLSGVAVNSLFGAAIGIISIYHSDKIQNALTWLNGSLASISPSDAKILVIYSLIAISLSFLVIPKCNLLALDDLTITNLGENLSLTRFVIATIAVLLCSISVCIVGIIGFVGLVVPHIAQLLVGTNHKIMLPFSMLLGSVFVLASDTFQIIVFSPTEIPVGVIISMIGAPFFLLLLRKQNI
jgi:iron complex transport system permease protein